MAKFWLRCGCCSRVFEIEGPDEICPDCLAKEGLLGQAEPGVDFDSPQWLERQARVHPAQEVKDG